MVYRKIFGYSGGGLKDGSVPMVTQTGYGGTKKSSTDVQCETRNGGVDISVSYYMNTVKASSANKTD